MSAWSSTSSKSFYMSQSIQCNTNLDEQSPRDNESNNRMGSDANQEGHVMLTSHNTSPATTSLIPIPGFQFDGQDESSPTNIRKPGVELDRVPFARRSTHRSVGVTSCGLESSCLPVCVKGIASGRVDEVDVAPGVREVTDVGSVFFSVPQNQFVRSTVAFATLWLSQTNMTVDTTIFRGRHLVPGITSRIPLVSAAIQK